VLQEARLAPVNICYFGSIQVPLITILRAVSWLQHEGSLLDMKNVQARNGLRCVLEILDLLDHKHGHYSNRKLSFQDLVAMAQSFERTEPRDGIFAILGMLSREQPEFKPDYTSRIGEVLEEATRHALAENYDLSPLRFVHHRSRDLRASETASWVWRADWQHNPETDPQPLPDQFCAAQGLGPPLRLMEKPDPFSRYLVLEGFICDRMKVLFTTDPCIVPDSPNVVLTSREGLIDFERWLENSLTIVTKQLTLGRKRYVLHAVAAAITVERTSSGSRTTQTHLKAMVHYLECLMDKVHMPYDTDFRLAREAMLKQCDLSHVRNRVLFMTRGGYIGLGPLATLQQDVIGILRGSNYPCVLRYTNCGKFARYWLESDGFSQGKHISFVGLAYVHGMMDGEVVREFREGNNPTLLETEIAVS